MYILSIYTTFESNISHSKRQEHASQFDDNSKTMICFFTDNDMFSQLIQGESKHCNSNERGNKRHSILIHSKVICVKSFSYSYNLWELLLISTFGTEVA